MRFSFSFPRQQRSRFLCIADFIQSREAAKAAGRVDVMPFQLVTMGQPIADFANKLFAEDAYRDYLEVHGIGVQLTEALAEYWHQRVRSELKFGDRSMDSEDPEHAQASSTSNTAVRVSPSATAPARTSRTARR